MELGGCIKRIATERNLPESKTTDFRESGLARGRVIRGVRTEGYGCGAPRRDTMRNDKRGRKKRTLRT